MDGDCGNDIVGRLGLQRIAVGGSAELSYADAVHHRMNGASDFFGLLDRRRRPCARVEQRGDVDLRWRLDSFDGGSRKWGSTAFHSDGDF